ncbi:inner membrane protein [Saccharicrinis carchari]|uniref:Inner membrane protein n=1 Tax=Saccharicrinis carchari TaxID=1168039 RepID=A0A521AYR9_SACCC|nr:metal-dependent hydrolase [Saccharicrinis carchari]SMO39965.1 inner membrane protein [Saccharicrinis carchari]
MDLVTQTVLGAAVGEVVLGKKAGNKAILWGAVGGLIPDLDVLVSPLYNTVDGLFVHRGFSHALLFSFLLAPPLGWLIHRIHREKESITVRQWAMLLFWAAFTHPLLDYFTTYGTGAFLPFSNYRVEFGTIGIVDIFYTLPFIFALFVIPFFKRSSLFRRRLILSTVFVTSFYLLATVANKMHVNTVFKAAFAGQQINYDRFKTAPLPLSNFLWMGMAETDSGYYMALYSNFDSEKPKYFMYIPRNEKKLREISGNEDLKKLIRFTKGYYHVDEDKNGLYLADLRFGKMGIDENADYIFKFYLKDKNGRVDIQKSTQSRSVEDAALSQLISRIKGI